MIKLPVKIDENGCAVVDGVIPKTAIMTVMNATEVVVYEEGDEFPTFDTGEPGISV